MKVLVFSSGVIDSTTCLSLAVNDLGKENVSSISIYYGQKHKKEIEASRKIADYYNVQHYEFDLSSIFSFSNCPLLQNSTEEIQHKSYADQQREANGMVSTYVPFRNGLFLSICATFAMSIYPNEDTLIYIGVHADDAAGNAYADCSEAFIENMNKAIKKGTYNKVNIIAPFVNKNKSEIVTVGLKLGTPYELTWSCYEGGKKPCGTCGTCIDRQKAFEDNNVIDPILR